ncbi:MAG TPA: MFS transporter, partial [Methylomirabilota bacterium]|nr:MFS transporter [Methylomirabilota bacterium]
LAVAMFLGSFAWGFVFISLPFHVQAISTVDPASTLRWTGWIVGITSLVTVLTGPAWGRFAAGGDPKAYWVIVQLLQGFGFCGMAVARTLLELFVARVVLGFMGAASTLAFILAGREPDPAEVRRQIAGVQAAMTLGQVIGPLGGAVAASRLGFRASFVLGGAILAGSAAVVHWGVTSSPPSAPALAPERRAAPRDVARAFLIILAGSMQLFFLTAVLPQILTDLGVAADRTVEVGGVVVFAAAAAAALGSLVTPRLGALGSDRALLAGLLVASAAGLAVLGAMPSVWPFTLVRFLQVLCIAPVFPLVVSRIAQQAGGGTIGTVNSARIAGSFVGPVVATTILAAASPAVLYVLLAAVGLACVPLALRRVPGSPAT